MKSLLICALASFPVMALCGQQELKWKDQKLTYRAGLFFTLDSNIERDDRPTSSFGSSLFAGLTYKNPIPKPTLTLDYELARHEFSHSSTWDRVSQQLAVEYSKKASDLWEPFVQAEISLKGSSEDREIFDQYLIKPGVTYEIDGATRLVLEQAFRRRIYDDNAQTAANSYTELTLRRRIAKGRRLDLSARREQNNANDSRYDFDRTSYAVEYQQDLSKASRLTLEARVKLKDYTSRTIKKPTDPLRRDNNLIFTALYENALSDNWIFSFEFRFEGRDSNEIGKPFDENRFTIGLTHRWGTGH